jgi:hypothetical protein
MSFEGVSDPMDTLHLLFIGGWYDPVVKFGNVCGQVLLSNVYDNTEMFREMIFIKDSNLTWKDKKIPSWAINILSE